MNKYLSLFLLASVAVFASCDKDDDNNSNEPISVTEGMYVINEGNYYSSIDGSLSYLDYATDKINNKVFQQANGISLGGTPNDGIIFNDMLVIPATDEQMVWFVDSKTFKVVDKLSLNFQPRKITADENRVYISTYSGRVIAYNPETKVAEMSEVIGACLEDIVYLNGYIYVCNTYNADYTYNTNVVKLNASDLRKVKDITVVCNPSQIETDGKDIYVMSYGDYASVGSAIQKIDSQDNVKTLCEGSNFTLGNDVLYYYVTSYDENWQSIISYNTYDLTTGKIAPFIDGNDIEYPGSIAFDSNNNYIYVSAYHLSEYGYGDYNTPGYIVKYDLKGNKLGSYDAGVGPKTMVFKTSVK